jgi:hypothetical protein
MHKTLGSIPARKKRRKGGREGILRTKKTFQREKVPKGEQ